MSSTSSPRLVVFDLGRVLVRICDGWNEAFTHAGLGHLGNEVDQRIRDRGLRGQLGELVHALERGAMTPEVWCDKSAALLERTPAELAATLDAYIRGAYPGAVDLLDALRAVGHATACLSNTNARHWELMSAWDAPADRIFPRLGLRCASHELAARKPEAEIYAQLESRAAAAPSQIVFFDDLVDNVAAANERGWDAVLVRSREDPVGEMLAALRARGLL